MSVSAKICRRMSPRTFAVSAIALTIILCLYYASYTTDMRASQSQNTKTNPEDNVLTPNPHRTIREPDRIVAASKDFLSCPKLDPSEADVSTVDVFKDFDFQPTWMKSKEYWDKTFEDRYERQKMDAERPPLKVIIVPHSHNDPGWLKTFENYFHSSSRQIMNNMVAKLQQYKNLTFIWSEVVFLNAWWEEAHPSKQRFLRDLIKSGRLEITTGGWVMTDEANAHVYAMVDQLIEGHQWILSNLDVKPTTGWSVDPFGHGSTQPYIMGAAGLKGAVIQRVHYAWKQWLALKQYGDFRWIPSWTPADPSGSILTHNQPYDIYSIKHSCGPHPYVCLNFDFRKVAGEYTEYSVKAQAITEKNIKEKSELLLEQYARTGSLFPHNVVLVPLGDDFRYNIEEEFDQQYTNYVKLIDYINANKETYKTEISFGTPRDYFREITKRYDQFPTLKGDFFVYSDIFAEGRPAYWSGYFTTRPFMKILDRELENALRGAEILYTMALNRARQQKSIHLKMLERDFEKLIKARRNLGLFQHHDAITGTSKSFVMRDYGLKLFEGIRDTVSIQQNSLQSLLFPSMSIKPGENIILSDLERDSYEKLPKKTPLNLGVKETRKIILYNSLAQPREQLIQVRTNTSDVKVVDSEGNDIIFQVNPVFDLDSSTKIWIVPNEYEVVFIAKLNELSITTFSLIYMQEGESNVATVYCNKCQRKTNTVTNSEKLISKFQIKNIPPGNIQLENHRVKLLFNGESGFMKTITRKHNPKIMQCGIQFAAYRSAQFHSGAYLFMPDPNERDIEKDVLQSYKDQLNIIITSGPVSSELTVIYGQFLIHTVTIYHLENSYLANGIYIENTVDFGTPPKNRETELFMRLVTDVQNGEPPELYTDLNGFQMQKRVKVEKIGIEGNYFPVTTMAYIQDEHIRVTLLTDHAQGASGWQPGFLELMLDRRTLYDDARGMGEGVVDNKKTVHKNWLLIEDVIELKTGKSAHPKRFENDDTFEKGDVIRSFNVPTDSGEPLKSESYSTPSLFANQMSNSLIYPAGIFILDKDHQDETPKDMRLLYKQFPCDTHLMTLRTQPDPVYSQFPSSSALLVLHRQGFNCAVNNSFVCNLSKFKSGFEQVEVKDIQPKTLTGMDDLGEHIDSLDNIYIEPMTLKTFNMTFV